MNDSKNDRIYIVRHGERIDTTDPEWEKTAGRPHDPFLADKGIIQANEIASRLTDEPITRIFASPFYRCVQTAHIIAEALKLPVNIEHGICEFLYPDWYDFPLDLLSLDALKKEFPMLNDKHTSTTPLPGPEHSEMESVKRAGKAARVIRDAVSGPILFVGHGASCSGICYGFTGEVMYQGLCTLTILNKSDNEWVFEQAGDTRHLSDTSNLRAW